MRGQPLHRVGDDKAIRTLVRDRAANTLSYHVGAGIVADSDPAMEYEETLLKAEGIRLALEPR